MNIEEDILSACDAFHSARIRASETPEVALAHKYPPEVILATMEKMVEKGLLDYGVSLRTAWRVQKES